MPETVKMLIVLTVIAGMAGLGLSAMNTSTIPLIAENERLFTLSSINSVLPDSESPDPCAKAEPGFDNSPDQDVVCVEGMKIYRARKGDEITGMAVESVGDEAYDGTILTLVGMRIEDGTLMGIEVLRHKETPGLGSLFTKCEFQQQMVGKKIDDINWTVAKDGGDIDQLSGATISTRCMLNAIAKVQKLWKEHREDIVSAEPLGEGEVCNGK